MDRTSAITRLNTEEIATEVNNVIKKGLDKLLGDHLYRYELLEKTHDAIMNLPSVRNHLNLPPQQYNPEPTTNNVKYEQMIEKLLKRIDELTFEVNQLKQTCKKESTDVRVEDELKVVKLEQKENIRLEIEEAYDDASDSDDEGSVLSKAESLEEEEEEEEDATVASLEEENICSECDCKVILDEDIVVVDGKKYCGACDPTSNKEEESEAEEEEEAEEEAEEEEEEEVEEVVATVVDEEVEEAAEEATVASLEEEVVEEEEADEVETEKSESVASEAEAEEEEEFIEIDIDDVTYCTNNEENGFIYELTEDGDVGEKVGYLKDGEPFFYADEK